MQFWELFQHYKHDGSTPAAAAVLGIVAITGGTLYMALQYLQADHQKTARLRSAKQKYHPPKAHAISEEAPQADKQRREAIVRELGAMGIDLTRLMEKIDGVAPALVLEAAQLDPWAEHEEELRKDACKAGLAQVFEMTGDLRAIRKGLIKKAERKAQTVDGLRKTVLAIKPDQE
ncbi:hypothetical protein BX661DRAFT_225764 [Kickxella alabastrina]|uniref:uncharacterized protein n=1 Tax=Kickxella alabastrina TaxID=61397 RepID=UPI0022209EAE|nr:uncharacterized protein BX661DRAFT_225764 [Kickxella alabastrina]KAI7824528.1 hypothetical protein BX661DRAFT_225764 [Kickxella alabastrina]